MKKKSEASGREAWISEEEAHRLLARAVELDAEQGAAVSLRELRQAAEEAGIPRDAFEQALVELRAGELEPLTVGRKVSMKLVEFRRAGVVISFVTAAGITPGDSLVLSLVGGLGLYGAYEGAIALARLLGRNSPPRVPPGVGQVGVSVVGKRLRDLPEEERGTRFVMVVRRFLRGPDHSAA